MASIALRERHKLKMRHIDENEDQMVVKSLSVPLGLEALMEGLTREVLKVQPQDICLFASEYFAKLIKIREKTEVGYKFCKTTVNDKNKQNNLQPKSASQNPKDEIEMLNNDASLSVPQLDLAKITNDGLDSPEIKLNRSEASTAEIDKIHSGFFESKELSEGKASDTKEQTNMEDETIEANELKKIQIGNESALNENIIIQGNVVKVEENLRTENENKLEIVDDNITDILQEIEEVNETTEQNKKEEIRVYSDVSQENNNIVEINNDINSQENEKDINVEIIENKFNEEIKEIDNNINITEQKEMNNYEEDEKINKFDTILTEQENKEIKLGNNENIEDVIHIETNVSEMIDTQKSELDEIKSISEIELLTENTDDNFKIIEENEQTVQEVSNTENDNLSDSNDVIIDEAIVQQSTKEILDENGDKIIDERIEDLKENHENNQRSVSLEEIENISALEVLQTTNEEKEKLEKESTQEEPNKELTNKQNNAATKIQSIWRGYNIRKNKTNDDNTKNETLFNANYETLHNMAATKIQSLWKGFNQRKNKNPFQTGNILLNSVAKENILKLTSTAEEKSNLEVNEVQNVANKQEEELNIISQEIQNKNNVEDIDTAIINISENIDNNTKILQEEIETKADLILDISHEINDSNKLEYLKNNLDTSIDKISVNNILENKLETEIIDYDKEGKKNENNNIEETLINLENKIPEYAEKSIEINNFVDSEAEHLENKIEIISTDTDKNKTDKTKYIINEHEILLDDKEEINEDHTQPIEESETIENKISESEEDEDIKETINPSSVLPEHKTNEIENLVSSSEIELNNKETHNTSTNSEDKESEESAVEVTEKTKVTFTVGPYDKIEIEETKSNLTEEMEIAENIIDDITEDAKKHVEEILDISKKMEESTDELDKSNKNEGTDNSLDTSINFEEQILIDEKPLINEIGLQHSSELHDSLILPELNENQDAKQDNSTINKSISLQHSGEMHDSISLIHEISTDVSENEIQDSTDDNKTQNSSNIFEEKSEEITNNLDTSIAEISEKIHVANKQEKEINVITQEIGNENDVEDMDTAVVNISENVDNNTKKLQEEIETKADLILDISQETDEPDKLKDLTNNIDTTIDNTLEQIAYHAEKVEGEINNVNDSSNNILQDANDNEIIENTAGTILKEELQELQVSNTDEIINNEKQETSDTLMKLNDEISEVADISKTVEGNINTEAELLENSVEKKTEELNHITQEDINELSTDVEENITSVTNNLIDKITEFQNEGLKSLNENMQDALKISEQNSEDFNKEISRNLEVDRSNSFENVSNLVAELSETNEHIDKEDVNNIVENSNVAVLENNVGKIIQNEEENIVVDTIGELQNTLNETKENIVENTNETVTNLKQDIKERALEIEDKLYELKGDLIQTNYNIHEGIENEDRNIKNSANKLKEKNEEESNSLEDPTNETTIAHENKTQDISDISQSTLQEDKTSNLEDTSVNISEQQDVVESNEHIEEKSPKENETELEESYSVKSEVKPILTENQAATKIQSTWRGYNSRQKQKDNEENLQKSLENKKLSEQEDETESNNTEILSKAATTLQAGVRGYLVRKRRNISTNSSADNSNLTTVNNSQEINSLPEKIIEEQNKSELHDETITKEENNKNSIDEMEKDLDEIKALNERLKTLTKYNAYEEDISLSENGTNENSLELENIIEKLKESDSENAENHETTESIHPNISTNTDNFDSSKYDLKVNTFSPRSKTSSPFEELSSAAYKIGAVIAVDDNSVLNAINPQEKTEEKDVEYIHIPLHGSILEETEKIVEEPIKVIHNSSTDNKTQSLDDSESPEYIYIPLKAPEGTDNQEKNNSLSKHSLEKTGGLQHSGEMHDSIGIIEDISKQISLNEVSKNASDMETLLNTTNVQQTEEMHDSLVFTEAEEEKQLNTEHNSKASFESKNFIDNLAPEQNAPIEDQPTVQDNNISADTKDVIKQNVVIDSKLEDNGTELVQDFSINNNVDIKKETLNNYIDNNVNVEPNEDIKNVLLLENEVGNKTELNTEDNNLNNIVASEEDKVVDGKTEEMDTIQSSIDNNNIKEESSHDTRKNFIESNKEHFSESIDSKPLENKSEVSSEINEENKIDIISNTNETDIKDNEEINTAIELPNNQESEDNINNTDDKNKISEKVEETLMKHHTNLDSETNNDKSTNDNVSTEKIDENTNVDQDTEIMNKENEIVDDKTKSNLTVIEENLTKNEDTIKSSNADVQNESFKVDGQIENSDTNLEISENESQNALIINKQFESQNIDTIDSNINSNEVLSVNHKDINSSEKSNTYLEEQNPENQESTITERNISDVNIITNTNTNPNKSKEEISNELNSDLKQQENDQENNETAKQISDGINKITNEEPNIEKSKEENQNKLTSMEINIDKNKIHNSETNTSSNISKVSDNDEALEKNEENSNSDENIQQNEINNEETSENNKDQNINLDNTVDTVLEEQNKNENNDTENKESFKVEQNIDKKKQETNNEATNELGQMNLKNQEDLENNTLNGINNSKIDIENSKIEHQERISSEDVTEEENTSNKNKNKQNIKAVQSVESTHESSPKESPKTNEQTETPSKATNNIEEKQTESIQTNESNENKLNKTVEFPKPVSSSNSPIDDVDAFLERNKSRSSSRQSNSDTATNKKLFDEIDTIIESYEQKRQMSPTNLVQSSTEASEIANDSLNQGQQLSVQENLPDVEMLRAENAAATKIQSAFKGFKTRQKMKIKKEIATERKNSLESNKTYTIGNPSPNNITSPEEASSDEESTKNAAALKIQNTYRNYRQKRSLSEKEIQDHSSNDNQIKNMNLAALEDKFLDYPVLNNNDTKEELKDISEMSHNAIYRGFKPNLSHENSLNAELASIPEAASPNNENTNSTINKSNSVTGRDFEDNATDEDREVATSGIQSESSIYDGDESDGKSSPDGNRAQGYDANLTRGVEALGTTTHDTIDIKISSEELSQGAEMLTSQDAELTASGGGDDAAHAADVHSDMETANNKQKQMPAEQQQQNMEKRQNGNEALAATKIQAGFRGYQVRKQMKIKKNGSEEAKTSKRGGSGRRRNSGRRGANEAPKPTNDLEERSATKIQAGIRGFLVRKRQRNSKDVIA